MCFYLSDVTQDHSGREHMQSLFSRPYKSYHPGRIYRCLVVRIRHCSSHRRYHLYITDRVIIFIMYLYLADVTQDHSGHEDMQSLLCQPYE